MLELRAELCRATNLDESRLPFAGELIQVRSDERDLGRRDRAGPAQFRAFAAGGGRQLCAGSRVGGPDQSPRPSGLLPGAAAASGRSRERASGFARTQNLDQTGFGLLWMAGGRDRAA